MVGFAGDENEVEEEEEVVEVTTSSNGEASALSSTTVKLIALAVQYGITAKARQDAAGAVVVQELVRNGIGALDARFFGGKKHSAKGLGIRLRRFELDGRIWLSVAENGCGMTRGDLVNRLAAVGANRADRGDEAEWKQLLRQGDMAKLLHELGAGVLGSSFTVGDALVIATRNVDDAAYRFEASAESSRVFIRELDESDEFFGGGLAKPMSNKFPRDCGTVVSVKLRPEWTDALDDAALSAVAKAVADTSQYSIKIATDLANLDEEDDARGDDSSYTVLNQDEDEVVSPEPPASSSSEPLASSFHRKSYAERAKYIPLRLSYNERKLLRLVESSVKVSGYVDRVDDAEVARRPARRKQLQLQGVTAVLTALVVAVDYEEGQRTAAERDFASKAKFLRRCFEIARRYKILNPEKMRSEYGQLVYLLQDAASIEDLKELVGVELAAPVKTVYALLRDRGGLALLDDPLVRDATCEILPDPTKTRAQLQHAIKRKEQAVKLLGKRYAADRLSVDDVELCLCSICDNESYLNSNRLPIDQTLNMLRACFDPREPSDETYSLAIAHGDRGARLSHSHARQFKFAEQSLSLWRAIVDDMFRLWHLAEADLLSGDAPYDLRDTGQGLQRVQACPRTYSAMLAILKDERADAAKGARRPEYETKTSANGVSHGGSKSDWVGSSMIHMGDHNVSAIEDHFLNSERISPL